MGRPKGSKNKVLKDLTGKFGRLSILKRTGGYYHNTPEVYCRCDCGKFLNLPYGNILAGTTTSCGCYRKKAAAEQHTTHGLRNTRVWHVWASMLQRCNNPKSRDYKYYGGRGIRVCERWHKFENFFADAGHPPEGLTIDRIDNDGDYDPGNCRWATRLQQSHNSRRYKGS